MAQENIIVDLINNSLAVDDVYVRSIILDTNMVLHLDRNAESTLTVDLAPIVGMFTDVHISSGRFDSATNQIVLSYTDTTVPDISIDMSSIIMDEYAGRNYDPTHQYAIGDIVTVPVDGNLYMAVAAPQTGAPNIVGSGWEILNKSFDDSGVVKYTDANRPVTTTNKVATMDDISASGGGDMAKATYDSNDNGVVDNSERVGGNTVLTPVPTGALFTDTIYNDTTINNKIDTHKSDHTNPHAVTKAQVGLANANNTSDANKPISTLTQTALNGKVNNSRVLTDVPANAVFTDTNYDDTAIQAEVTSNTTDIATNTTNIGTNTTSIATNTTNIATNTTKIATNTSGIATNVTAIATKEDSIGNPGANGGVLSSSASGTRYWRKVVGSEVSGITGATQVDFLMQITQAGYDALSPNQNTMYVIVG